MLVCLLSVALGVSALAQTGGTTHLSGRAVDAGGTPLPGVTITAFLAGFQTTTLTRVQTVPGETTALEDIVLQLACADEILVVQRSLPAEARGADLVAHVRVESIAAAREWRGEYSCVIAHEVTAWVEADAAQGARRRMRFLTGTHHTFERGDEYVAAFGWGTVARRYMALPSGAGSERHCHTRRPVCIGRARAPDGR
jgi:hypothetical protein